MTVLDVTPAVATSALKAKDGTAVADVGTSFTSIFNSNTDITYFNAAGTTVTRHTTWTLDTDGRLARKTTFGPGPDGMLKTIDDVPTWYEQWTYSSNGNRHVSFNGAGADATWFTADESSPRMSTPTHP